MNETSKIVTINSRKLDGSIGRSWQASFIEQENSLLTFIGVFEEEVKHKDLGVIRRGTISYEFYWLDRWYNVFRFHEPEGDLRNFYCNLNVPPKFENDVLDYVDLDIDVLVWKDFKLEILDLDDFEENAEKFKYSKEIKQNAEKSLVELLNMIKMKMFPFDFKQD